MNSEASFAEDVPSENGESPESKMDTHVSLGPVDFQRLGVPQTETRLAVIRHAAVRAAKSLASKQLSDPSTLTEQQLYQVAVSTYRLLDPRQRADKHSRAHVGRIRPGALYHAGRAEFADHRSLLIDRSKVSKARAANSPPSDEAPPESPGDADPQLNFELPVQTFIGAPIEKEAASKETVWKKWVHHPAVLFTMIVLLLSAAGGLLIWGRNLDSARLRAQESTQLPGK